MTPRIRLLLDFAPLAVFFVAYKLYGIMAATAAIMAMTVLSLAVIYILERKIAVTPLVTGIMVTVFGSLTLFLNDATFIKMKPTIINLIFAAILIIGYMLGKGLLQYILGQAFQLSEQGWRIISLRWGLFFMFLAALNEYIWRNYPEEFWVNFKVFGMFTLTMLFTLSQVWLIRKYMMSNDE